MIPGLVWEASRRIGRGVYHRWDCGRVCSIGQLGSGTGKVEQRLGASGHRGEGDGFDPWGQRVSEGRSERELRRSAGAGCQVGPRGRRGRGGRAAAEQEGSGPRQERGLVGLSTGVWAAGRRGRAGCGLGRPTGLLGCLGWISGFFPFLFLFLFFF